MAELKTKATDVDVSAFVKRVNDATKRADSEALIALLRKVTKEEPRLWGPTILGFGSYHYKYESGHEGDMCLLGFSPRKDAISIYFTTGFDLHADLLPRLGKHKLGKACLYVKRLADIDLEILTEMLQRTARAITTNAGATPRAESRKTSGKPAAKSAAKPANRPATRSTMKAAVKSAPKKAAVKSAPKSRRAPTS